MEKIYKYINVKRFIANFLKKKIYNMGFINQRMHYIHGPKDRLKTKGKVYLVNTIFNTRSGNITLGNMVGFGHNCMVLTGKHDYEAALNDVNLLSNVQEEGRDIIIGDGTWIASGSIILGSIKIGKNCVIMAGAVVTKDVPDYSIVAGIPAKVIRSLK